MAYEFKDMATVDMIETVADTTNVLIEEDGKIKRANKSAIAPEFDVILIKGIYDEDGIYESLPSGTFDKIKNKLLNKEPIIILFMVTYIGDDGAIEYGCHIAYDIDMYEGDDYIHVYSYNYEVYINSDDTIEPY